jgi:Uma2 family endonuclease
MSTVTKSRSEEKPAKSRKRRSAPYRYGWREEWVKGRDGKETHRIIPLTEEDILFPLVGDNIVQTTRHNQDVGYLKSVSEAQLAGDRGAVVISDCLVDWNLRGRRPLCPDLAVFFGVEHAPDREWDTFNVASEAAEPALVAEVTSRSTRRNDLGKKVELYHRARVPFYLIAEATERGNERRIELIGYRYAPRGYKRVQPDALGRIYLEALRVWIGVVQDPPGGGERLACYEPATGAEIGNYAAVVAALAAAEARADAEARRAEAEAQRADAEARARVAAEARIRELEAELKRSRSRKSR